MSAHTDVTNHIPLRVLLRESLNLALVNRRLSAIMLGSIFVLAFAFAIFRPREYVVSMIVTPIELTLTDPGSLITTQAVSIRTPLNLTNQPPPQMAAFIRLLKSPELARRLAKDPRSRDAIVPKRGFLSWIVGGVASIFGLQSNEPDTPDKLTSPILTWLESHVTAEQDVDVKTWNVNLRYSDRDTGLYLLVKVHDFTENILRETAVSQFQRQQSYGVAALKATVDDAQKSTLYSILDTIQRSLLVLLSGANVATIVISNPYAPDHPNYPAPMLSFFIVLLPLLILAGGYMILRTYRDLKRGHTIETAPVVE